MHKLSVLVPVYNVATYLRQCLDSIVHQTMGGLEIICINDGSTDGSLAILEEYAQRDDRIKVISKPNSGYGHTMNVGLKAATGEYIGIVESDDYAEPDMFELLYNTAANNHADAVKSNFFMYTSKPVEKNDFFELIPKADCNRLFHHLAYTKVFYRKPSIWSAIYRRSFLLENDIWFTETPGASYQDSAFNFKVWACSQRSVFLQEALLHYRQDNENSSVNSKGKVYCVCDEYQEMERFLDKRPELKIDLELLLHRIKYDTYIWNYDRLAEEFKLPFLQKMAEEYHLAQSQGKLHEPLFELGRWQSLQQIMENPEEFHLQEEYRKKHFPQDEITRLKLELKQVYASRSYKVGRALTYFPRKMKTAILYSRQYGLGFTCKFACKKLWGGK